jgi:hypothetical protein
LALRTADFNFYGGLLTQLVNVGTQGKTPEERGTNFMLAMVTPHTITVYASPWSSPPTTQHSLPGGRYPLPGPDFHRLDRASFAWRTTTPLIFLVHIWREYGAFPYSMLKCWRMRLS